MRLLLFNLATDADDPILGFTTRWISALAEHMESIDVITMRSGKIEVPKNVRVHSVGKEKGYSEPRRAIEFYRILGRLLTEQHYDVCFAHMMPLFALMAAPLLRILKIPIVLWYAHKSVNALLRLATFLVDEVVTSTQEGFRIPSSKVQVIGQGIDTGKFAPKQEGTSPNQTFTILTVGRLSPIKRVELLIEAVALCKEKHPELSVRVKIVGAAATDTDKFYEAKLFSLVKKYHMQTIVIFTGSKSYEQLVHVYHQADCFVNLSETGSIDKAVLEAMSCGLPVITNPAFTNLLGTDLSHWVIDGNPLKLCDRLLLLASMSEIERCKLGQQLRNIVVQEHSLTGLCTKLVREFKSVKKLYQKK
ncbi:MAG: glycosyltransferase family 4 protein [candidate division WOR-3 bacterium]